MREIKFRAWLKRYEMMVDVEKISMTSGRIYFDSDWWEEYELMQYTGIKDKNGKEIYEGDIVKSPCGIRKVIFVDGGFCLDTGDFATDLYRMIDSKGNHLEVIGNIYENPELLEVVR